MYNAVYQKTKLDEKTEHLSAMGHMRTSFFNHDVLYSAMDTKSPTASLALPTGVSLLQSLLHSHYSSDCIIIDVVFLKCPSPVIKSQRSQCIPVYANYRSQPSSLCRLQHRAVWVREVQRPTGEKQTRDAHNLTICAIY